MFVRTAFLFAIATAAAADSGECKFDCDDNDSVAMLQEKIRTFPAPAEKALHDVGKIAADVLAGKANPSTAVAEAAQRLQAASFKAEAHIAHAKAGAAAPHFRTIADNMAHAQAAAATHAQAAAVPPHSFTIAAHVVAPHAPQVVAPSVAAAAPHFTDRFGIADHMAAAAAQAHHFSPAKAQAETAHDLKEAVKASQHKYLSEMKFPHHFTTTAAAPHYREAAWLPHNHAAIGNTGYYIPLPSFRIKMGHEPEAAPVSYTAAAAEYLAMTLFVVIGCGCAMAVCNEPGWVLQVALTFGLAISALAYTVGHWSGAQINCAVTLGLVLSGKVTVAQGLFNFIAQMLGSITGAFILTHMIPEEQDKTGGLGTNTVNEKLTKFNAFVGEFAMTFLLMFVVLQTAVNPETKSTREMAALAIGFAVFLAHSLLINIDGCSINPTRTFGPAFVRQLCYKNKAESFEEQWVFWVGPLLGAAGAAAVASMMS